MSLKKCSKILSKSNKNLWKFHHLFPQRFYSTKLKEYLSSFSNVYDQKTVEKFWSGIWFDVGLFKQTTEIKNDPNAFRLLLPPPNITGNLHLGHSLTVAIQDTLCRYHRMNGRPVIWYGGTDHAGIATQMLVEKMLFTKYSKYRYEISKEDFDKHLEKWKLDKISNIHEQLKALGAGIDFDESYFTLSSELQDFVQDSFINLFNRGLIYRASYMVNWSYYLQSTLSDIEIEHKFISKPTMMTVPGCEEQFQVGVLHRFRYPVIDPSTTCFDHSSDYCDYLSISTTRIESLMGDVALAVHPDDDRYSRFIGFSAYNPFTRNRMPIIADPEVKMDFGTGVLKLTPAHSNVDAEIAKKHRLPMDLVIFDEKGFIDCHYKKLNGIHRYSAKKLMVDELVELGLYEGVDDHPHWLPLCSRSGDIIESKQVPQWFLNADQARFITEFVVNRDNLTEESQQKWNKCMLKQRNISVIPSGYRNTWRDWFSRYKDWCISRQITWGHQIPAYEIFDASSQSLGWVAAKSEEEAKKLAIKKFIELDSSDFTIKRDKDVLDTWFSSALLPVAVSKEYPISLMETGHDILFFWVARMVLMSILLKNQLPFERILLHGMICDQSGKKMSKSKGNVIDPMHIIEGSNLDGLLSSLKEQFNSGAISEQIFTNRLEEILKTLPRGIDVCGADILRLSLLQSDFKEQKVNFNLQKTLKRRAFVNKMHQTVKFVLLKLEEQPDIIPNLKKLPQVEELSKMERWIFLRLANLIQDVRECFFSYDLHRAAMKIEHFWTDDICDVFVEHTKIEKKSFAVLVEVIMTTLKVMHPFMPFITENLFQHILYRTGSETFKSILSSPYPDVNKSSLLSASDPTLERDFDTVFMILTKIRWFKQHFHVNREQLVKNILIISNNHRIEQYFPEIKSHIKIPDCDLGFLPLHDIYNLDDYSQNWYCFPLKESQETLSKNTGNEKQTTEFLSSSLHSDEIYIAFQMERELLYQRLEEPKLGLKRENIEKIIAEFDGSNCRNFTKNFKKITKIKV